MATRTTRKRTREPLEALAAALVPSEIPNLDEFFGEADPGLESLWDRLKERRGYPSLVATCASQERIQKMLPAEARKEFARYMDAEAERENAVMQAAYELGVNVGLRLSAPRWRVRD